MTLPTKGSRLIVVDGIEYRWMVADRNDQYPGVVTTLAERPGRVLVWTRHAVEPDFVTPGLVADCIRAALIIGWCPAEAGPPFRIFNGERIGA